MKSLILRWSALLSLASIFGLNSAYAKAGSLDPTFGQGGKVVSSFGSPVEVAGAALQSDGKILVLISNDLSNFALVRFLSNGTVDTSFGSGGSAQTIFASFNMPQSVSVQSDGKIVVSGIATNDEINYEFVAARFNANGSLDSAFGSGGQTSVALAGTLGESVSLLQPDGKILIAGSTIINPRQPTLLALARFNPDGTLDSSFGSGGAFEQAGAAHFCSSLALDSAGNVFVVGGSAVAIFNSGGNALAQAASSTMVATASGGNSGATAFQPDGRFLFAEEIAEGRRDNDTRVVRFTASGAVDPTFNNATFDFSGEGGIAGDITNAMAVLPNGQIMLGATHFAGGFSNELFALARLNSNGSLDPTFGVGGIVTTSVGGSEGVAALLVQPDGRIIAIGTANSFSDVALARYLAQ